MVGLVPTIQGSTSSAANSRHRSGQDRGISTSGTLDPRDKPACAAEAASARRRPEDDTWESYEWDRTLENHSLQWSTGRGPAARERGRLLNGNRIGATTCGCADRLSGAGRAHRRRAGPASGIASSAPPSEKSRTRHASGGRPGILIHPCSGVARRPNWRFCGVVERALDGKSVCYVDDEVIC
jgi:hypothetical protein